MMTDINSWKICVHTRSNSMAPAVPLIIQYLILLDISELDPAYITVLNKTPEAEPTEESEMPEA